MSRKWSVLAATMGTSALLVASFSVAEDENETPLGKIMTKVNKTNVAIRKAVSTPVNFRKANNGKDVSKQADELVKLAKQAKPLKDAAKKAKVQNPEARWDELMDAFIKASEDLSQAANKDGATQPQVKAAYDKVNKACATCHTDFRVEDQ